MTGRLPSAARRALVADHRMSRLLIRAVRHRKGVRIGPAAGGRHGWTRRNFGRWLFEDYPRAMVVTPPLAPGHVHRPGAYRVPIP